MTIGILTLRHLKGGGLITAVHEGSSLLAGNSGVTLLVQETLSHYRSVVKCNFHNLLYKVAGFPSLSPKP